MKWRKIVIGIGIIFLILACGFLVFYFTSPAGAPPIKVGILHSQSGAMADSEKNLIDIELLAIEELNEKGGIAGRKLQAIIADGKSDEIIFAEEAERLITKEHVDVIIGCWTSSSRKAVKEVVEKHKSLLLYPLQYEGIEESANIFYLGATPNQQVIPAATWCIKNLGKRFYLIGSDYVFPHVVHKLLRLHVASLGGSIVGETFIKLGATVTSATIRDIVQSKPDVICNSINGISNNSFFKELALAGISPEKIPTMSFSIGEPEIKAFDRAAIIGAYCASTYYQRLDSESNTTLLHNFKQKYGTDRIVGDAMQSAYSLLFMWAKAANTAQSVKPGDVIPHLQEQIFISPAGLIYFAGGHCVWQNAIIGKINFDGNFIPLWSAQKQICPEPFPPYLSKQEWVEYLNQLYEKWGKRWSVG